MVPPKPKSKRTPVRLRHKIQKASAAKQRKQRKLAKGNPEWRSRLKKDPGIPNLFPYKDRILQDIEEKKRFKEEQFARKRDEAKAARGDAMNSATTDADLEDEALSGSDELIDDEDMDNDPPNDSSNPMAALLASAKARAAEYEELSDASNDFMDQDDQESLSTTKAPPEFVEYSRHAFDKIFKSVLSSADIILYVLDARDPNGTRSRAIERQVAAAALGSKRLLLVLNKIDLVPPPILKAWLIHLRRSFPTLPLRASTPAPNARIFDHKALTVKSTSETLLRALKAYATHQNLKRAITVGVIGYPNVGKSSVINALTARLHTTRATACPVGAEAGVTTTLREVKLDSRLKLLDCPGIVFPSSEGESTAVGGKRDKVAEQARLILLNALPPKQIVDPVPAVTMLLLRISTSPEAFAKLLDVYGLPPLMGSGNDITTDFLVQVARKRGRLGKGGVPNVRSAAMTVVMDWRDGRIQGWVDPPKNEVEGGDGDGVEGDRKEIVKEWAAEFKLEGLWGDDGEAMGDGKEIKADKMVMEE